MDQAYENVTVLYRGLLGRDLDPAATDKVLRLSSRQSSMEEVIKEIVSSDEFSVRYSANQARALDFGAPKLFNDQSQFGEFEFLLRFWVNSFARHRIVVDVGARGRERSNSYDLMNSFGWQGVLFEANPNLIASIQDDFSGLNYELVQCAISDYEGDAVFHLGINDDVSSLDPDAASGWGPIAGSVTVRVERLGAALSKRSIPDDFDLLSIDIEGEDIKVLNDLLDNSDYRPRWVVIEASYNFETKSLDDLPVSEKVRSSYVLVGQTVANLILRHV